MLKLESLLKGDQSLTSKTIENYIQMFADTVKPETNMKFAHVTTTNENFVLEPSKRVAAR
jgi:hypothetical protein